MIGWLILIAYAFGVLFVLPTGYRVLIKELAMGSEPKNEDTWAAAGFGLALSLFWPLWLVVAAIRRMGMRVNERRHEEVR